ncbi:endoplasmic oxidoreductin-1 [[Candida] jaroonii]|uniref:Endoplasmic oxidoreductin-1 n=1 Tax=[Candida] jaroonii TaxID=467808 RepID=A0ACA9YBM7_9ASCO|nr:endoplasmic oxidoreductin-1 [[Candida] jaroonii]
MKMNINLLWLFIFINGIIGFTPFYSSDFCSQTITNDCNTTFSYIDSINDAVYPTLKKLVASPYFRYFKINFDKQCKFWDEEYFCASRNCAVELSSRSEVNWDEDLFLNDGSGSKVLDRDEVLSSCNDLDYCEIDDDDNADVANLVNNPERFTGYAGKQAQNIWSAIYNENCFKNDDGSIDSESCSAKQLFFRVVSGMHASISTHLSNEYLFEKEDYDTYEPNLKVFMERVGKFNDRISNLYFNYGLISQSIIQLFKNYPIIELLKHDGTEESNHEESLVELISLLEKESLFKTSLIIEPEYKNEFRNKFRNISSIMDCVGCDRCRMWGKLQTIGYGTALKILNEENDSSLVFRRIEIVSLFNTFDRLSKSIESVKNFKQMYLEHLQDVEKGLVQPGDFDKLTDKNGLSFPFLKDSRELKSKINQMKEIKTDSSEVPKKDTKPVEPVRQGRLKQDFNQSLDEVYKALKFVLNSYRVFPMIILKQTLIRLNYYWNAFIGIDTNEYYEEFQLQQEQQYINLFND